MPFYDAFGLSWQMPFICPEMGEALPNSTADVTVSFGSVPSFLNEATSINRFLQITPKAILFNFPEVGSYFIQGGHSVVINPCEEAAEDDIRQILLGSVAALLLHQRGLVPLHASGIRTNRGAVLFMGHSGFGKSTLLATFLARGYHMLTDDLAAIKVDASSRPLVFSGYPQFKLWADSAEKLCQNTDGLRRILPDLDKFAVPTNSALQKEPLPLYAVYMLTPDDHSEPYLEPVSSIQKFSAFFEHTTQKAAVRGLSRQVDHFQQIGALANQTRVFRVYRPEKPFLPHPLADLIEQDFQAELPITNANGM